MPDSPEGGQIFFAPITRANSGIPVFRHVFRSWSWCACLRRVTFSIHARVAARRFIHASSARCAPRCPCIQQQHLLGGAEAFARKTSPARVAAWKHGAHREGMLPRNRGSLGIQAHWARCVSSVSSVCAAPIARTRVKFMLGPICSAWVGVDPLLKKKEVRSTKMECRLELTSFYSVGFPLYSAAVVYLAPFGHLFNHIHNRRGRMTRKGFYHTYSSCH